MAHSSIRQGRFTQFLATLRTWALAPLLVFSLMLSACGGGDGDSSTAPPPGAQGCSASTCGTVFLSLTDTDGDFLSYTVDVVSLTLKKANGAMVETLPVSARVDFVQLVDITEFVTAATIPDGVYVEGSIRLDYTNAEVSVEVNGAPRAAQVVGADGKPLGVVDLRIMLDNRNHVFIAPGRPSWLELDFDLAVSHTVDVTTTPVRAVAEPFIVASLEPVDSKEMRVRGPLVSADIAASQYVIDVRPFDHRDGRFGQLTVHTTAQTAYEIDGQTFTGAPGLDALARLGADTPTAAFGTLERSEHRFTAERVHAGTSVPGPSFDVVRGNVIARAGDTLTVRGATLIRRSGSVTFVRDDITVLVGADTQVTRDGQRGNDVGDQAISIGQRIAAFGQVTESNGEVTLDADPGRVRLHLTHLWGLVKSANPGALTLDLASIDGRRLEIFDFSGTGTSAANDADPDNYEIATSALNLDALVPDSPTRVFGFVTPFGAAPPDFEGRTLVDFSEVPAILGIGWGMSGTSAPFLSIGNDGITIDNANAAISARHFIAIGPRLIDIKTLATPPRIVPASGLGRYAIGQPLRVEVFGDFAAFSTRLAEKLSGGAEALGMSATGEFEAGTSTLTSRHVFVSLTAGS
jgi:hypothetical protein